MHWAPTFNRNVFFLFAFLLTSISFSLFFFFLVVVFLYARVETITAGRHTFVCFRSSAAMDLIGVPVALFHNSTSSGVWAFAVSSRGHGEKKKKKKKIKCGAERDVYQGQAVMRQSSPTVLVTVQIPVIRARRRNVEMSTRTHTQTLPQERERERLRNSEFIQDLTNLSAFGIKLGLVYLWGEMKELKSIIQNEDDEY